MKNTIKNFIFGFILLIMPAIAQNTLYIIIDSPYHPPGTMVILAADEQSFAADFFPEDNADMDYLKRLNIRQFSMPEVEFPYNSGTLTWDAHKLWTDERVQVALNIMADRISWVDSVKIIISDAYLVENIDYSALVEKPLELIAPGTDTTVEILAILFSDYLSASMEARIKNGALDLDSSCPIP